MKKRIAVVFALVLTVALSFVTHSLTAFADTGHTIMVTNGLATVDVTDDALLYENGNSSKDGSHRWADYDSYFIYKANFGSVTAGAVAFLTYYNSRNCSLQLSMDGQSWEEVMYADGGSSESFTMHYETCVTKIGADKSDPNAFKLKVVLDDYLADDGSVFIKGCAHNTAYGWGGDLRALEFRVEGQYVVEVQNGGSTVLDLADSSLFYATTGSATGSLNETTHRYADKTNSFTYKVKFDAQSENNYLVVFYKGSNRALYAGFDSENLTLIGSALSNGDNADTAVYKTGDDIRGYYCYYKLDDYCAADGTVYVKFGALDTSTGNGADVFYVSFISGFTDATFGQSSGSVNMRGNDMVVDVLVTDLGAGENDGAGLLVHGGALALSAQGNQSFTYRIDLADNADPSRTYVRVETRGKHNNLEASADGTNFVQIGKPGADDHGAVVRDGDVYFYSLTQYAGGSSVYLRFSSVDKQGDAEAFLRSLTVFANRNYETELVLPTNYAFVIDTLYAGDKETGYFREDLSYRENTNNMDDAGYRYYDSVSYGVYELTCDPAAVALILVFDVRGGYRFAVSDNATEWKDVLIGDVMCARAQAMLPKDYMQANITGLIDATKGKVFIKVADATTDGGWGGAFTSIALMSVVEKDAATPVPTLFAEGKINTSVALYDPRLLFDGADMTGNAYLGRKIMSEDGYFTYKFDLPTDARSFYIAMKADNLSVTVSTDGTNFATVENAYILDDTNGYGSMRTYSLTHLLANGKTVYVRFAKTTKSDEGILYTLYAGYNVTENAGKEYADRNVQAFLANDQSETEYLFEYDYTQMGITNKYKEFNRTSYAVYKFANDTQATAVKLIASIGNSFCISVSSDNVTYRDVVISDQQFYGNLHLSDDTVRDIYIDITPYVSGEYIYVKITDLIDDNDCGAQLRGLGIITMKGDEVKKSEKQPTNPTDSEQGGSGKGKGGCVGVAASSCSAAAVVLLLAGMVLLSVKKKSNVR